MLKLRRWISAFCAVLALGAAQQRRSEAATTRVVRDDSFETLQQGELDGVAISSDGFLYPSYARRTVGDTETEIVWTVLQVGKNEVLCATGHDGKLIRIDADGDATVIAELPDPELTAMVALEDGSILVGGAPSGRIYRVGEDDEVTTFTQIEAKFIWDLEVDDEGTIWAATGTEGKLYRITQRRGEVQAEVAIDFPSRNIIDLWIDREGLMGEKGLIYIAGEDPGWVYSYKDGDENPTVVYDAAKNEIRALVPTEEGLILAINSDRAPSAQALNLTLRMSGASTATPGGATGSGSGSSSSRPGSRPGGRSSGEGDAFSTPSARPSGGPSSSIVLLTPDGFARDLWTSPERPIHSISVTPEGRLLISAGGKGRLFELLDHNAFAVVTDVEEDYLVRIVPVEDGWLLTAARNGLVFHLDHESAREAVYRSRIIDAETPVRWGRFYWRGEMNRGQKVTVAFRRGNSDDPEIDHWEDWSKGEEIENGKGVMIEGPPARYLQYQLTLQNGRRANGKLKTDYVEAFYQRPNRSPRVTSLTISSGPAPRAGSSGGSSSTSTAASRASGASPRPSSSGSSGSRGGSAGSRGGASSRVQGGGRDSHSNTGNINVTWSARDPNGDTLVYALYFKAGDETEWKLIDDELRTSRLSIGLKGVGDGKYRFRIVASDEFSNPPGMGLKSEFISDEVIIDNTPPQVENLRVRTSNENARVTFQAVDELSFISSIEIDFDGEDAYPIFPRDGLLDQREEQIDWTTPALEPGEHTLTLQVTDREGNTSVARRVFTIRP